jgi:transcriptional regulator with XRE-family HTH domain
VKREVDPKRLLAAAIERHGSQRALARHLGVSQAYVWQLLTGRSPFSDGILEKLGLRRTVVVDK